MSRELNSTNPHFWLLLAATVLLPGVGVVAGATTGQLWLRNL